jgi:hypothetical protein
LDRLLGVDGQGERFDAPPGQRAERGRRPGGREDAAVGGVEGQGQGVANTAGGAAGFLPKNRIILSVNYFEGRRSAARQRKCCCSWASA